MGNYLKQNEVNAEAKKKRGTKTKAKGDGDAMKVVVTGPVSSFGSKSESLQHDINYLHGMDGIEQSLDWIARGLEKLTSDDRSVSLSMFTGHNSEPVKVALAPNDHDDTMDRFVSAVERIADSLARLAGLSRPRLEHWYEQDEYTPRFKAIAVDGGAPGPKEEE